MIYSARDDLFYLRLAEVTTDTDDGSIMARGMNIKLQNADIAHKMENGSFSFSDALGLVLQGRHLGEWWETLAEWPLEEFRMYAEGNGGFEENARKFLEEGRDIPEYHDQAGGEVAIVVIGKKPENFDDDWSNSENGALKPGDPIQVFEIQYDGGWGWQVLNGNATVPA